MNVFTKRLEGLRERAVQVDNIRRGRMPAGVLCFDGSAWRLNGAAYESEDAAREAFDGEVLIVIDV